MLNPYDFLIMFEGFEVSGGQINPDLLDFSYPLYFPVFFSLNIIIYGYI